MTPENKAIAFKYALEQMPKEACGVLIIEKGREVFVPCKNNSEFLTQFEMDALDYAAAEERGEVVGIFHSHVYSNPQPSEVDLVSCEATKLPWFIVSVPNGDWYCFTPTGYKAPLVGRSWAHGLLDCYSLIRDYYREELNITLPDYEREFEWWLKGANLYLDNFKAAGFKEVPIEDIQRHDGILMQIGSPVVNHAGVYLGNDKMLHHLHRRLSCRDIYGGYYKRKTLKVVRFEGL